MKSYWLLCVTLISDVALDHFGDSIEDPTIHECPVGEFPVTYKIVEQGSKRGKVKLIDSNGYTQYQVTRSERRLLALDTRHIQKEPQDPSF